VSRATLYAYVSRGLLRSEARAGSRARAYRAEDVEALLRRREERRDPARAAAEALHWGAPVLGSALTLISDGRLYYRGLDAQELAEEASLEEVASLLWRGDRRLPLPDALPEHGPALDAARRLAASLPPLEGFQLVLAALAAEDPAAWDLSPEGMQRSGARILHLLAALASGGEVSSLPVAEVLRRAWAPHAPDTRRLLDGALVLWADHELNVSTFTARCIASALAPPHAVVCGALSALRGARHGGATEQVAALFDEVAEPGYARRALEERLRRGERLPGFGHPLYPDGDPRAAWLLERLGRARPRAREHELAGALARAAFELVERRPNVDFALVALCRGLGLPPRAPLALVGIARSVGWIAHAIEQIEDGRLLRPRARYTGPPPAP
jgi:citrate synthase